MNLLRQLASAVDALWAGIDPDEPIFCECEGARWCTDCSLSGIVEPAADWTVAAPPIAAA